MSVLTWLRGLRNTLTTANRRARRSTSRRRPPIRLEVLEGRITPSGGLPDPTFGANGLVTLPNSTASRVVDTAAQADGKIIAVGYTTVASKFSDANYASVTRLNGDGTLDQSFGTQGTALFPIGTNANSEAVTLQPDGKVLVAVNVAVNSSGSDTEFAIMRLNQNGTLDTSFGNNHGLWLANPTTGGEVIRKIAIVPDSTSFNIYAAGVGSGKVAAVKLNANGQLDSAYGTNGISLSVPASTSYAGEVATPQGGLLAVNATGEAFVLNGNTFLALNSSGSLDTNFNGTGVVPQVPMRVLHDISVQGDEILVSGLLGIAPGNMEGMVARYTMSGTLDPTFGTDGTYLTPPSMGQMVQFNDAQPEADGSLAVAGFANYMDASGNNAFGPLVGHLTAEGVVDTTFGTSGTGFVLVTDLPLYPQESPPLTLDPNGNLLVCGRFSTSSPNGFVMRFTGPTTAPTDSFSVTGFPSTTTAGSPGAITVTALNPDGSPDAGYSGTVQITSSDPHAVLPGTVTLTNGVGVFNVTLVTAGTQSITATDTTTGSITDGEPGIAVAPAAASAFSVTGFPSPTRVGVAGTFTVTAFDPYGNLATGYSGTVQFSSSDGLAALPANYTFSAADNGAHTFSATLNTVGTQSLTAADTATGSIAGTQTGITVNPASLPAVSLSVTGFPSTTTAGAAGTITVTAKDVNGNVATGYAGTIHFTSSDQRAGLPADYTFTAADQGVQTFNLTLVTAGTRSITATDTTTGSILGSESGITVIPAAASQFLLRAPSSAKNGTKFSVTLTVEDAYGNVATGYVGTVHFTSSDRTATLPANYTFTTADAGKHTFTNGVTLKKRGTQTVTAADLHNGALTATDVVNVT